MQLSSNLDDHPNNLPVLLNGLIGREYEIHAMKELLSRPDMRLLTLTGTAGVGKTRLALEVARELGGDFADGVHVVFLAPISDPALVMPTIAHTLGLTESASQSVLDLLTSSQRDKHQLLLLDNFEHLVSEAPELTELLEACPELKILSRAERSCACVPNINTPFHPSPCRIPGTSQMNNTSRMWQQ